MNDFISFLFLTISIFTPFFSFLLSLVSLLKVCLRFSLFHIEMYFLLKLILIYQHFTFLHFNYFHYLYFHYLKFKFQMFVQMLSLSRHSLCSIVSFMFLIRFLFFFYLLLFYLAIFFVLAFIFFLSLFLKPFYSTLF